MPAEYEQSAERGPPSEPPSQGAEHDEFRERLLPPGNPPRLGGLLFAIPGLLVLLLLMAADRHFAFSVPLGSVAAALAAYGILDTLGTFDDPGAVAGKRSLSELALPAFACATTLLALIAAVRLAVAGVLPHPIATSGLLVTLLSLSFLVTAYRLLAALTGSGEERPLWRREGFWLLALAMLIYLPLLGSFSLIDPWETHYGEVAREMLARDDWISFWWAQEGWFWSKPALDFWLQGLSFLLFGVRYRPDEMLAAAGEGRFPQPEWAARLPIIALTLIASYLAYKAVARVAGRRAGLLGGWVLVTAPYWFLLAHQSMTDMPYAAPLTAGLSLLLIGLHTEPEAKVRLYEICCGRRRLRVSLAHGVLMLVLVTALPQILYLLSRNVTVFSGGALVRLHWDQFFSGSGGGNCGLPGNEACEPAAPVNAVFQPVVGALVWSVGLVLFLWANRGERRQQRWAFLAGWYFVALAVLAKGAPGLVLALVVAAAAVCVSRRFRDFARLELVGFLLLLSIVALPWYVQAFMRHGPAFSDRLLFYDMYKRAFVHVHDTNAGDDTSFRYYVWQLGYGLFPWTGLGVAGLISAFSRRDEAENRQAELRSFLLLWFLLAFCLFSVSLTKFHHYALPAVPPLALLTGLVLDRLLERPLVSSAEAGSARFESAKLGLFCVFAAGIVALVGRDLATDGAVEGRARLLHLFAYNYARPWPRTLDFEPTLRAFSVLGATLSALGLVPKLRRLALRGFLVLSGVFAVFGAAVYLVRLAPHYGQRETILAYYTTRAGPEEPLVAYQMNWKGENFYTGNHLPAFITTGEKFKGWVRSQKEAGTRVLYFTTEHSRLGTLKSELGKVRSFQLLTKPELNNKFFLARVEL
jgi:4-amino-4-deoxy-L-arabinose transferase-like glycosyltransferase